ncbi:hypothetical protein MIND_00706800 [Mycena indigotica]|uniref:Transmembrane protein n=1 Tax=Mycena indigotica TaxID=2126181 RepID=A0A8H6SKI7_9AGAR|nr:uncharacterized protein MIND_00706800 [Mycena indigotica]KAF7301415.1 hypothetical protein MIND_00706800 [Mycena indigotica]
MVHARPNGQKGNRKRNMGERERCVTGRCVTSRDLALLDANVRVDHKMQGLWAGATSMARRRLWAKSYNVGLKRASAVRQYASNPKSPMGNWYSTILPSMFPIALLASAVYTGLLFAQLSLSHEKTMEEQAARLKQLEAEVDMLAKNASKN